MAQSIITGLRSLSATQQYVVCLMLTVAELQFGIGAQLLLSLLPSSVPLVTSASFPQKALIVILLGTVLQVCVPDLI